jgi:hypothetical protein
VRILTAASLHGGLTAEMLKASELVPAVLAALTTATDALAIPLVDLRHNLTLTRTLTRTRTRTRTLTRTLTLTLTLTLILTLTPTLTLTTTPNPNHHP